jgi:hypothetical protein
VSHTALVSDYPGNQRGGRHELTGGCAGVAAELDGFRGTAILGRRELRELTLHFALLLGEAPQVVEADLNPVCHAASDRCG